MTTKYIVANIGGQDKAAGNIGIAKSMADVGFIIYSSLVIFCSNMRNSFELLFITSSINYVSADVPTDEQ